ncbi:MAG: radical SAM protein [Candidatus Omnitrophota bacterium]
MEKKIIRKTKSRCLKCGSIVPAAVIEKEGKVYLEKKCPEHNFTSLLISDNSDLYRDLENFYFSVMPDNLKSWAREIDLTFRCNMNCPICACDRKFRAAKACFEPTIEEIKYFLEKSKIPVFKLSGGEPTCREDLLEIIRLVKSFKKTIVINTNGLKLSDLEYVRNLKQAGVDSINMSFDGFDEKVEKYFRGKNYLPDKIRALNNLRQLDIPTGLNITIAKGINETEIPKIIDYAAKNKNIKMLSFGTFSFMGNARNWDFSCYLMPDQLKNLIVEKTNGKISQNSIRIFQKLFIGMNSFFFQKFCLYDSGSTIIFREKGDYTSLDRHINLKPIEKHLDKYALIFKYSPILARAFLTIVGIFSLREIRSGLLARELFSRGISFFNKNSKYLRTKSLIYININTICDNYKIDYKIAKNCMYGLVFKSSDNILKLRGTGSEICEKILNSEISEF